jgi:hypothetical protein
MHWLKAGPWATSAPPPYLGFFPNDSSSSASSSSSFGSVDEAGPDDPDDSPMFAGTVGPPFFDGGPSPTDSYFSRSVSRVTTRRRCSGAQSQTENNIFKTRKEGMIIPDMTGCLYEMQVREKKKN